MRLGISSFGLVVCVAALAGACGSSANNAGSGGSSAAGGGAGGSGAVGAGGTGSPTSGLPCAVSDIVVNNCLSCHGNPPASGVPKSLTSLADFQSPSKTDPMKTMGEMSVQRMNDTTFPMPPTGQLAAADIQTFSDWVNGGMAAGDCSAGGAGGAAGSTGAGGFINAGGSTSYTPTCTSGQQWTLGDHGSSQMHPGVACIACHQTHWGTPSYTIAGTVFPSAHDTDNCYGAQGAQVMITDQNGPLPTLTTNAAGNFYYKGAVAWPITAKVVYNGKERAMQGEVQSGDCNSCHTEAGANNAPGRIALP